MMLKMMTYQRKSKRIHTLMNYSQMDSMRFMTH